MGEPGPVCVLPHLWWGRWPSGARSEGAEPGTSPFPVEGSFGFGWWERAPSASRLSARTTSPLLVELRSPGGRSLGWVNLVLFASSPTCGGGGGRAERGRRGQNPGHPPFLSKVRLGLVGGSEPPPLLACRREPPPPFSSSFAWVWLVGASPPPLLACRREPPPPFPSSFARQGGGKAWLPGADGGGLA